MCSFNRNIRRLNNKYLFSEKKINSWCEKKELLKQHRIHINALEQEVKDEEQVMLKATDDYEIAQEDQAAANFKSMR